MSPYYHSNTITYYYSNISKILELLYLRVWPLEPVRVVNISTMIDGAERLLFSNLTIRMS